MQAYVARRFLAKETPWYLCGCERCTIVLCHCTDLRREAKVADKQTGVETAGRLFSDMWEKKYVFALKIQIRHYTRTKMPGAPTICSYECRPLLRVVSGQKRPLDICSDPSILVFQLATWNTVSGTQTDVRRTEAFRMRGKKINVHCTGS